MVVAAEIVISWSLYQHDYQFLNLEKRERKECNVKKIEKMSIRELRTELIVARHCLEMIAIAPDITNDNNPVASLMRQVAREFYTIIGEEINWDREWKQTKKDFIDDIQVSH